MPLDPFDRLVALAAAGGGLVLAGVLGVLVGGRPRARLAVAAGSAALALIAAAAASLDAVAPAAAVLAVVFLTAAVLRSRWLTVARAWVVRPGAAAAAGLVVVVATAVAIDREQEALVVANAEALELAVGGPPPRRTDRIAAVTDRGTRIELATPIELRDPDEVRARGASYLPKVGGNGTVIRRGPADERTNCFGWVFAHGRSWVPDTAIDTILSDHAYRPVTDPRPGDVAVYRDRTSGAPVHAALVRYVTPGQPVLVEGKWGWMGVFIHDADRSPYGVTYAYYRTPRATHQLALTTPDSGPEPPLTGAE